ncbi:MAG: HpcH/HpaI aldolase/citrate lyase family protein, partial [Chloroflexota bacterium]
MVRKAMSLEADAVMLDLEDGVGADGKAEARRAAAQALALSDWGNRGRLVRVNGLGTGQTLRDLLAIVPAGPEVVVMPKVESAVDVGVVAAILEDLEAEHGLAGRIGILPMLETPRGVLAAGTILQAGPRLSGVLFGAADFVAVTGGAETVGREELDYPR